jgi:hypothetical protein
MTGAVERTATTGFSMMGGIPIPLGEGGNALPQLGD